MNRRKFTKSALGIIALAPFASGYYGKPVFGVDKAIGKDQTARIYKSYVRIIRDGEKIPSGRKFAFAKSINPTFRHGYNCKCILVKK